MKQFNKLCLGTVKLGMPDYGFSSGNTLSNKLEPVKFLNQVESLGITHFDTSPRYGQSEKILGRYISQTVSTPFVSSKIDNLKPNNRNSQNEMIASVIASLNNLSLKKLDICYLHQNEMNIISDPYIHEGMIQLKKQNLIENTGVSVYSFEECHYAIDVGIFDYIQVPANVFDVSFYNHFILKNNSNVRFVGRSLLLQGLLVNRNQIVDRISTGKEILKYLTQLDKIASENNLSTLEMSLSFVYSLQNINHYLIGTTSVENLQNNIESFKVKLPTRVFDLIYEIASQPKIWSNPRSWI